MICLYAIFSGSDRLALYYRSGTNHELLLKHLHTSAAKSHSKLVCYSMYYLKQDNYLFVLCTFNQERSRSMQNYLRAVADVFYQSYEEQKFDTVLARIIAELNLIEAEHSRTVTFNDEEDSGLVDKIFDQDKKCVKGIVDKHNRESRRAFITVLLLVLAIVSLSIYYIFIKVYGED